MPEVRQILPERAVPLVESAKSNGSGSETASDGMEVLEALEGHTALFQVLARPRRANTRSANSAAQRSE